MAIGHISAWAQQPQEQHWGTCFPRAGEWEGSSEPGFQPPRVTWPSLRHWRGLSEAGEEGAVWPRRAGGPCGLCVWLLGGERWAEGWGLPPHRPCPACSPSLHSPFPGALCPGVAGAPPAATPNKQQRGSRRERGHASRLLRAQARQLQGNSRPSPWPTPGRQETRGGLCTPGRHSQLRASPWWGRRASRCPLDPGPRKKTPNVLIPFHNSLGTSHLGTNTTHFFLIYSYFSPACPCGEGVSSVRSLFVLSLPPCPPRGTLTGSVQGSGEKAPSPSLPV